MQSVQMKMARAALDLSPADLAGQAGVDVNVVEALEQGSTGSEDAIQALHLFLSSHGIELIGDDGVRAKGNGAAHVTVEELTTENDGGEG